MICLRVEICCIERGVCHSSTVGSSSLEGYTCFDAQVSERLRRVRQLYGQRVRYMTQS